MNNISIETVGGVIGLVFILLCIFAYYKFFVPKESDRDKAMEFIMGFGGKFEDIVKRVCTEVNFTKYNTLEELEADIFAIAYDECWKYVEEQASIAVEDSTIGSLVASCITRENVERIVKAVINDKKLMIPAANSYTAHVEAELKKAEEFEAEHQAIVDAYETGSVEVEPFDENSIKEEPEEINPPTEDGTSEFSEDDDSQEIIEE